MKQWPIIPELAVRLDELRARDILRSEPRPTSALSFARNDYLGLADSLGSGASRLLGAERAALDALECKLDAWLQGQCTVLSSGYAANMAMIGALIGPNDLVLSDARNHASLVDALRLTKARVLVFPHLDLQAALEQSATRGSAQRVWCVIESYYSMDADSPDIDAWLQALEQVDVRVLVDESHAIGLFGDGGRGLCWSASRRPHAISFGLGKAFASMGGVVCGAQPLRATLVNFGRPLMFSTAPPPALLESVQRRLHYIAQAEAQRRLALARAAVFRSKLAGLGYRLLGHGPIVPVVVGDENSALQLSRRLLSLGMDAPAIRYPTVPIGEARLRINLSLTHTDAQLDQLVAALGAYP